MMVKLMYFFALYHFVKFVLQILGNAFIQFTFLFTFSK